MSLYIGKLSGRVGRDELERVFRRFGHCNVQMKSEGYGFVVFDFRKDAENALRALKGRNICGEPLTLMWSKQQPKSHFTKFDKGGGRSAHELQGGRVFDRLGYGGKKQGFDGRRNHNMSIVERGKSDDMSGVKRGYNEDGFKDCGGEKKDRGGDFPDEGGGVVPNQEENGKCVEPTHDLEIDYGNGNTLEFDRYEPSRCYDRKNGKEDYSGSFRKVHSQENVGRAQIGEDTLNCPNGSKFQQTCGEAGHKMQNCRKERTLRRKYNRSELDDGKDDKIDKRRRVEDDIKPVHGSWVNPQSNSDASLTSHQRDKWRVSDSQHDCAPLRNVSSLVTKEADIYQRKEYGGRKQSKNIIESPKRSRAKISRQSVSSSMLSDCSAYRSLTHSQSSKSLPRPSPYCRSRSVSSRAHSSSPKLRSSSKSQNCRGKKLHSMSSSSPTSLSGSLDQPLLSSPNKIQFNSKSSSTDADAALEPMDHMVAQGQQIGSTMGLENLQSKDSGIAVNGQAAVSTTAVDATAKDQHEQVDNNEDLTKPIVAGNLYPRRVKEAEGFQNSGTLMVDDIDITTEVQKPTLETHINSSSGRSTIISTEEMHMVLSKSGLDLPKGHEIKLTTDDFFGAARLWPWYIIYYRRLKKGPISIENYARRVAQNQEFGIVDKYIRSSSGWGEFSLEHS
ncbi:serine/arginine-rich splicing factor 4-like protein [Trifolium pratense]|uniref:Serine/arginine-rich splicing factor 4-like protein n=2 Tax=Trifolium pratense TaxID=57577 RepID=A0A2K3PKY0_TRIPR|nr:serine/arginine-rich splicing factor 4-like protein [Trifolium pratense]CAJ2672772.1 unnamed protein product [Trifolium pratense]